MFYSPVLLSKIEIKLTSIIINLMPWLNNEYPLQPSQLRLKFSLYDLCQTTFHCKPITFKYQFSKAGSISYNTFPVAGADKICSIPSNQFYVPVQFLGQKVFILTITLIL